jgi:hypothetical protein
MTWTVQHGALREIERNIIMIRIRHHLLLSTLLLLLLPLTIEAKVIATITKDLQTAFGVYHPYPVRVTPSVTPYTLNPDFSNVANFSRFSFSEAEKALLFKNGFVAQPSSAKQIYDVYNECKEREIPIFVTTDAMLHTFHILYDYALRILEMRRLAGILDRLTKDLVEQTQTQYDQAIDGKARTALLKNFAYCSVATVLIDRTFSVPPLVKDLVDRELALIDAHQGFAPSPIFGYREDYSQYVPRGHYTRNETLQSYFRAMMWYGRMMFRITPPPPEGPEKGREETLQAILLVRAMHDLTTNGRFALRRWREIYDPTVFFVGKSDDLDIDDYTILIEEIYGPAYQSLPVDAFADDERLEVFIAKAKELRDPLINSS